MFDNKRYVTRGVNDTVPLSLQIMMWKMIDELRNTKKNIDYLQVFHVRFSSRYVCIKQSSSCPKYSCIHEFGVVDVVDIQEWTIWIMDDSVQSLMMFPEER